MCECERESILARFRPKPRHRLQTGTGEARSGASPFPIPHYSAFVKMKACAALAASEAFSGSV